MSLKLAAFGADPLVRAHQPLTRLTPSLYSIRSISSAQMS